MPDNPTWSLPDDPDPAITNSEDVGLDALRKIYRQMRVDHEWSARDARRFTWWMRDCAQCISVSEPVLSNGVTISTLVASTALVKEVVESSAAYEALSALNAHGATLSALVLGYDGTVSLVSSAVVHHDNMFWMPEYFALVSAVQAADAEIKSKAFAELLKGVPAHSAHPVSGSRLEYDDLANIIKQLVAPMGQSGSMWVGAAMEEAKAILTKTSLLAMGDSAGVTAEFPYGVLTALLQFETRNAHPQVGNGLHVTLRLPFPPLSKSAYEDATLLNRLDAVGNPMSILQGAWCVAPDGTADTVSFNAFFPNAVYRAGMSSNIAMWMSMKVDSVACLFDKRSREERWASAKPAVAALLLPEGDIDGVTEVRCWSCKQALTVTAENRGRKVRCPACGTKQQLPNDRGAGGRRSGIERVLNFFGRG